MAREVTGRSERRHGNHFKRRMGPALSTGGVDAANSMRRGLHRRSRVASERASQPEAYAPAITWSNHLGLIVSGALTALLVFKVLAVAGWDPNTAKGIVAASGTTNVLVGATIAILPTLYPLFIVSVLPRIQTRFALNERSSVERAAARMLETWPFTLLMFIVPIYLVLAVVALLALSIASMFIVRRRVKRSRTTRPEDRLSRFEANAVALAAVAWLLFFSLGTPWLPTESVKPEGSDPQVAYVLSQDSGEIVVLVDQPRRLERLDANSLERAYCDKPTHWFERTLLQLNAPPRYPRCPD